jgi:hypothetical protein
VVGRQLAPWASACRCAVGCGRRDCKVGAAVRLARLADSQIGDAGATALAAALPLMPSLTKLYLSCTATRARCGFLSLGLAHRWSGGSSRRVLRRASSVYGGGWQAFSGRSGSEACTHGSQATGSETRARLRWRRRCRRCRASRRSISAVRPRVRVAASCRWGSRIGGRAAARAVCFCKRARGRRLGGGLVGSER